MVCAVARLENDPHVADLVDDEEQEVALTSRSRWSHATAEVAMDEFQPFLGSEVHLTRGKASSSTW